MRRSPLAQSPHIAGLLIVLICGCVLTRTASAQVMIAVGSVPQADGATPNAGLMSVDEAVQNALTDFQRHAERNDWQKAFRVLENLPPEKRVGMLPTGDGFMVPAKTRMWQVMVNINAEGRAAFRLFNEPKAKQLYEKLTTELAANDPQATTTATTIYDQYFITSLGDDAANMLGDIAFEKGDFNEAATRWRSIIDYHADTEIPLPRLLAKCATAYIAAGRRSEAESLFAQLKQRYPTEKVTLGGKEVVSVDYVKGLLGQSTDAAQAAIANLKIELPAGTLQPVWQVPYLSKKGRAALQQATTANYYYQSGLETIVPNHASDAERIYLNWMGVIFAIDIQSGKLLWRTDSFDKVHEHFATMQQGRVDLNQYGIQVIGEKVLTTALPLDRLQYWQPAIPLTAWDAKTGNKQWTLGGEQNGNVSYLGRFYPWKGTSVLVVSHGQQQAAMTLNSLSLSTGANEWSMPLGNFHQENNPYSGGMMVPIPEFGEVGRQLCLMNNSGAVLQITPSEKKIDGQFVLYEQKQTTDGSNYYYGGQALPEEKRLHTRGRMLVRDGLLLLKEVGKSELYCVDVQSQKVLWKRPTVSSAMIVEADDRFVYLMNSELSAHDRLTGKLQWSVKLPVNGGGLSLVTAGESVFVATQRGIFEITKKDGRVRHIVRTAGSDSSGISMRIIGNHLVTVTNYDVCGYRISEAPLPVAPATSTPEPAPKSAP